MALKPPDMSDCGPKRRCLGGPNQGLAYDPKDPCLLGETFNSATCDCDPISSARSVWHADEVAYSYFGCGWTCEGAPPGDCSPNSNACSIEEFSTRDAIDFTTLPGPTPHELVSVTSTGDPTTPGCVYTNLCDPNDACYPSTCVTGSLSIWWRIRASDGTWLTGVMGAAGVGGAFCLGQGYELLCSSYPALVEYIPE